MKRHLRVPACLGLLAVLSACERAQLVESTDALLPAGVDVVYSLAAGGPVEAFQKSNRLLLRFRDSSTTRLESQVTFDGAASTTRVPVLVRLRRPSETMTFDLEVRRDANAVFRGTTRVPLRTGRTTTTSVVLEPVIAGIRMTDSIPQLTAWGDSVRLSAAAVFATGDTLPNVLIQWASLDTSVAKVDEQGVVVARTDGTARITARSGSLSDTGTVRILAAGISIQVSPAGANIPIGSARQYAVTIVDRRGNTITRSVTWTSSDTTVLRIDANGLARSVGIGTATVRATAGTLRGEVPASGVPAAPTVQNMVAVVTGPGTARLDARILPNGGTTDGWFEWGLATGSLPTGALTLRQSLGAGLNAIALTASLQGLLPNARYVARAVAVNNQGSTASDTVSFTTPAITPSVTTIGHTVSPAGITLAGAVNPNNSQTQVWFQWGTSPTLAGADSSAKQTITGLSTVQQTVNIPTPPPGTTLYFRIIARSAAGTSAGAILSTSATLPGSLAAITSTANGVASTSARLNGIVLTGNLVTTAAFEWGTDATLGVSSTTPVQVLPPSTSGVSLTYVLQNLSPNTAYFFRAIATNTSGSTGGAILSFTTQPDPTVPPPAAATLPAEILDLSVQMNGTATPNGATTNVWFEWSTDPGFATFSSTAPQSVPGASGTVAFSTRVVGIPNGVDHYYRAVASNAGGTVYGAVVTFRR
jgi:hypothetical protein